MEALDLFFFFFCTICCHYANVQVFPIKMSHVCLCIVCAYIAKNKIQNENLIQKYRYSDQIQPNTEAWLINALIKQL